MMKVEQGQCLIDVTLAGCGDLESIFSLAQLNGISITDDVEFGSEIATPAVPQPGIVNYYLQRNYKPATGFTPDQIEKGGIGYMQIGANFKVS